MSSLRVAFSTAATCERAPVVPVTEILDTGRCHCEHETRSVIILLSLSRRHLLLQPPTLVMLCCAETVIPYVGESHSVFAMRFCFSNLETVTKTANSVRQGGTEDDAEKEGEEEQFDVKHL